MEVSLENVKMLEEAMELISEEAGTLLEADYNLFINRQEGPRSADPVTPFEDRLDEIKDRILAQIPEDRTDAIEKLIGLYLEMLLSEDFNQTAAGFFCGWLFGCGQREAALRVINALPAVTKADLNSSLNHLTESLDKQVAKLEKSNVFRLRG